jgi:dihydroorotate dehydrogenase electron transfer subunit
VSTAAGATSTGGAPETPTGPRHVTGEILTTKKVGAYQHLTLAVPDVAERARPGTFVALPAGEGRLGRRAFWIRGVRTVGGFGSAVEVVVDPVGAGSRWLAGLPAGTRLAVTGPLGRPFSLPRDPVSCVLVGEGYSAACLLPLASRLKERGCTVVILLAAADESRLLAALEARRTARSVTVVTGDGSVGRAGGGASLADLVGAALPEVLARAEADVVYAAAPAATLERVAGAAEDAGAWSQTALEQPGPCLTGLCQGCAVPVLGEDRLVRMVRGCTEGPVLRGDRVRWDSLGRVPVETTGAGTA